MRIVSVLTAVAVLAFGGNGAAAERWMGASQQVPEPRNALAAEALADATVLPFAGTPTYNPTATNEADPQALNAWIRTPGNFDAAIDFDAVMRDPARPERRRPELDIGDHLHPSIAGYRAMADAVPLSLFK